MLRRNGATSPKVTNSTLAGWAGTLITAALVYYVPAWHHGLPGYATYLVSAAVGAGSAYVSGWLTTHKATAAEVASALKDAQLLSAVLGSLKPGTGSSTISQIDITEPK